MLWFFFGALAFHKFYAGRYFGGLLQLGIAVGCSFILLAADSVEYSPAPGSAAPAYMIALIGILFVLVWLLIDFIRILTGSYTDGNGNKITEWT